MIYMLAAAMTVAMLIATVFGLREEGQRIKVRQDIEPRRPFGPRV